MRTWANSGSSSKRTLTVLGNALLASTVFAVLASGLAYALPPQKAAPEEKPKAAPTCTLLTTEAPRGGRLEVEGTDFGKAPLVRIANRVTRIIERTETTIAVQIHKDSDGGEVTVQVGKARIPCGTLTIIGKDG